MRPDHYASLERDKKHCMQKLLVRDSIMRSSRNALKLLQVLSRLLVELQEFTASWMRHVQAQQFRPEGLGSF